MTSYIDIQTSYSLNYWLGKADQLIMEGDFMRANESFQEFFPYISMETYKYIVVVVREDSITVEAWLSRP